MVFIQSTKYQIFQSLLASMTDYYFLTKYSFIVPLDIPPYRKTVLLRTQS